MQTANCRLVIQTANCEEGASNNSNIFSRNGTRRGSNIDQVVNNAVNINISGHQFAPAPIREPRDQRAREPAFTLSPAIATATATATTTKSIVEAIAVYIQYDYENGNPPFCM